MNGETLRSEKALLCRGHLNRDWHDYRELTVWKEI